MSSSRRINALTKTGIQSLQQGRYVDAILSFRHALECVKSVHCNSAYDTQQDEMDEQYEIVHAPLDYMNAIINKDEEVLPVMVHPLSPHNLFEIYDCAYLFPRVMKDSEIADHQVEISAVLFYNIALAHHMAGLDLDIADSYKHLCEAQRYYKIGLAVVQQGSSDNMMMDCYSLILGMLNNLGFLYSHFCEVEQARLCSNSLNQFLLDSSADVMESLTKEQADFFCSAITQTKECQIAVAPAA